MGLPKCFERNEHKGDYLEEIMRIETNHALGEEKVIYWCSECGAIVGDIEYDNRRIHSEIPMKFPQIIKDMSK